MSWKIGPPPHRNRRLTNTSPCLSLTSDFSQRPLNMPASMLPSTDVSVERSTARLVPPTLSEITSLDLTRIAIFFFSSSSITRSLSTFARASSTAVLPATTSASASASALAMTAAAAFLVSSVAFARRATSALLSASRAAMSRRSTASKVVNTEIAAAAAVDSPEIATAAAELRGLSPFWASTACARRARSSVTSARFWAVSRL